MGRINISAHPSPTTQPKPIPVSDWRRSIPGLVISALSLVLVFYLVDFNKLIEALRLADYRFIVLSFLVTLAWLLVRGAAWRTLLQNRASYSAVFLTLNEGYLLNNLLPFRLGEVGRAFILSRKAGLEFWQVLSTVIIERILDMALAAALLFSTLPAVVGASWAREAAVGVGSVVLVGLVVLYSLANNRERVLVGFNKLVLRWPVLSRLGGKIIPQLFDGLAVLTDPRRFIQAIGWIVLNWALAVVQYLVLLAAFYSKTSLLWAGFTLGVAALGVAAPSSPGAVGVMELSIVGALSLFGLDVSIALALALTLHLVQYLVTGVIGAYALARDGESLSGLYARVREMVRK